MMNIIFNESVILNKNGVLVQRKGPEVKGNNLLNTLCNEKIQTQQRPDEPIEVDPTTAPYVCISNGCNKGFHFQVDYVNHNQKAHGQSADLPSFKIKFHAQNRKVLKLPFYKEYECKKRKCGFIFESEEELKDHTRNGHIHNVPMRIKTAISDSLENHLKHKRIEVDPTIHSKRDNLLVPEIHIMGDNSKIELANTDPDLNVCQLCLAGLFQRDELERHIVEKHKAKMTPILGKIAAPNTNFLCKLCYSKIQGQENYTQHVKNQHSHDSLVTDIEILASQNYAETVPEPLKEKCRNDVVNDKPISVKNENNFAYGFVCILCNKTFKGMNWSMEYEKHFRMVHPSLL